MIVAAVVKGAAAGAAGATALNATTYADMALRGRPASTVPQQAVEAVAARSGRAVPGEDWQRPNRVAGLGSLAGIGTGVGVGIAAGLLGPVLNRLPWKVSALLIGAGATAATTVPLKRLKVTDPAAWSAKDWAADAVPHLAYGAVTTGVLRRMGRPRVRPVPEPTKEKIMLRTKIKKAAGDAEIREKANAAAAYAAEKANVAATYTAEKVGQFADQVKQAAADAELKEKAQVRAHDVAERAERVSRRMQKRARKAERKARKKAKATARSVRKSARKDTDAIATKVSRRVRRAAARTEVRAQEATHAAAVKAEKKAGEIRKATEKAATKAEKKVKAAVK
jgi:hypothetical protein